MRPVLILSLSFLTACAPAPQKSSTQMCEQTVLDYGHLRDEGPAESYADLFTTDGEFHLGPNVTKGRDALIARHAQSNANTTWRHNMTDVRITEFENGLTGTTRFHIFTGPKSAKPAAPVREIIGDYIDEFVIENGSCKIKSRKVKIVFDTLN